MTPDAVPTSTQPGDPLVESFEPVDILDTGEAGGKAIRGGVVRALSFGAGILLSLASIPLMIRHLGVVDFGRFATVTSIVMIVAGVTEAGLTGIGMREFAVHPAATRRQLVANLAGMRAALTVAGAFVAIAFTLVAGYDRIVVLGTAVSSAGLVVLVLQQTYSIPLASSLRWGWYSALELLKQAVVVVLVVALVVAGARLMPFFFISVVSAAVVLAVTLVRLRHEVSWHLGFDVPEWKRLVRDALPYAAAATIGVIYFRVAIVMMSLISTDKQTGYYSAAFKIVEAVGGLAWILVQSAFPILARAARDDQDRLRYGLQRLFEVALIAGALMALGGVVVAPFAIDVVAGKGFDPAISVLRIQALTLGATFLVATWSLALLSLRQHGDILRANAFALLIAVAATFALVPHQGAKGAALATVAAEFGLAAAYAFFLMRRRRDLRPGLGTVPAVATGVAAATLVAVLLPLPSIALTALALAVYVAILLAMRAVPAELWHALSDIRRGSGGKVDEPGPGPVPE
jgi:O-antigen/teichoic acid export membrane protein